MASRKSIYGLWIKGQDVVPTEEIEGPEHFYSEAFRSSGPKDFLGQGSAYIEGYLQGVRGIPEFAK